MLKDDFDISIPISLYNELLVCWNNNNMDRIEATKGKLKVALELAKEEDNAEG